MAVATYLRRADESWNGYDGNSLASLLSFQDNHIRNPKLQVKILIQRANTTFKLFCIVYLGYTNISLT